MRASRPSTAPGILGIEAGGTRTTACWSELAAGSTGCESAHFPAANLQLISDPDLIRLFRAIARQFPRPVALGISMAGARTEADRQRIRRAADRIWRAVPVEATHDLESALAAADIDTPAGEPPAPRILVLSGTGSCCFGISPQGRRHRVGGWGHLLGDEGSAYDIALRALRSAVLERDRAGRWGILGARLLRALQLNEPDGLVGWIGRAGKREVAGLAPEVFTAAAEGDTLARDVLADAARELAADAIACARGLAPRSASPRFVFAGGVLVGQPAFAKTVARGIAAALPKARFETLRRSGAEGAAQVARLRLGLGDAGNPAARGVALEPLPHRAPGLIPVATRPAPTEARHPRSMDLDRMPLRAAIQLMIDEERRLPAALTREAADIEKATRLVAAALEKGGRLIYVGAGTSGRLGILDATECPPTFRSPPEQVQGILAGGAGAMFRSVEGAEDDFEAGSQALRGRAVGPKDVVVGIAASGRTPFVWGALAEARERRARTVLVCFHPHLKFAPGTRPDVVIAPDVGPELLTGSTRLKAGTATKLILNMLTTLAMVRLGKVMENLMIDLHPSNTKLRDRAVRITESLTGAERGDALKALESEGWHVRNAVMRLGRRPRRRSDRRRTGGAPGAATKARRAR